MRKLFALVFTILMYTQSFAYNILQTTTENVTPPPPGITLFADPGDLDDGSINFIVPFLLISTICLIFFIVKKNKAKAI